MNALVGLIRYIQSGNILFAGPFKEGNGGFILAHGDSLEHIQQMIANNPFDIHQLTSFHIKAAALPCGQMNFLHNGPLGRFLSK